MNLVYFCLTWSN